jgi:hypothetical protein
MAPLPPNRTKKNVCSGGLHTLKLELFVGDREVKIIAS